MVDDVFREVSGRPREENEGYRFIANHELLKALYIATAISPICLLTAKLVTSDTKCKVAVAHLGEVRRQSLVNLHSLIRSIV